MPAVCDGALSETSRHCFCTSTESPVSYDMSRCSAPQAPTRGGCHCRRDIGAAAPSTMRSISGVDNHRQSSLGSTLELAFDFFQCSAGGKRYCDRIHKNYIYHHLEYVINQFVVLYTFVYFFLSPYLCIESIQRQQQWFVSMSRLATHRAAEMREPLRQGASFCPAQLPNILDEQAHLPECSAIGR